MVTPLYWLRLFHGRALRGLLLLATSRLSGHVRGRSALPPRADISNGTSAFASFSSVSEMSGPMAGLSVESESGPKETFRLDRLRHQRHIEFVPTYGGGSVAEERVQRRLAAILTADVVDYSWPLG